MKNERWLNERINMPQALGCALLVAASVVGISAAVRSDSVEPGTKRVTIDQTIGGEILSKRIEIWYPISPDDVGCWPTLEDCGRAIRDECDRENRGVRNFSLRRDRDATNNDEPTDWCSGQCSGDGTSIGITITCRKTEPEKPIPVTRGQIVR